MTVLRFQEIMESLTTTHKTCVSDDSSQYDVDFEIEKEFNSSNNMDRQSEKVPLTKIATTLRAKAVTRTKGFWHNFVPKPSNRPYTLFQMSWLCFGIVLGISANLIGFFALFSSYHWSLSKYDNHGNSQTKTIQGQASDDVVWSNVLNESFAKLLPYPTISFIVLVFILLSVIPYLKRRRYCLRSPSSQQQQQQQQEQLRPLVIPKHHISRRFRMIFKFWFNVMIGIMIGTYASLIVLNYKFLLVDDDGESSSMEILVKRTFCNLCAHLVVIYIILLFYDWFDNMLRGSTSNDDTDIALLLATDDEGEIQCEDLLRLLQEDADSTTPLLLV